jgi:hypothetical protein
LALVHPDRVPFPIEHGALAGEIPGASLMRLADAGHGLLPVDWESGRTGDPRPHGKRPGGEGRDGESVTVVLGLRSSD